MKYLYYDYLECNLRDASPIITAWAQTNAVHMFDFDNCMFDPNFDSNIKIHLQWVKNNFQFLVVAECHPFFPDDELYQSKKNKILQISDELNLPAIVLNTDYKLWLFTNESKSTFHPDWYFRQRKWSRDNKYHLYQFKTERTFNFACGNKNNARTEKIYNYIECYSRRRKDWLITLYNHPESKISETNGVNFAGLNFEQVQLWDSEIRYQIPYYSYDYDKFERFDNPHSTLFPVHLDSYCNLVMEHTMEIPILSEKSFKPFIAKQIPIFLGAIYTAKALTYLGFDLFYDFIDHNKYDSLQINEWRRPENFTMRIDRVHQLIDELYNMPFTEFFHQEETQKRLQANQDYFYSDSIDKLCIRHFEQLLNK